MKRALAILWLVLLFIILKPINAENSKTAEVFYIANEGFMVVTENHKIIIDGLFGWDDFTYCHFPSDSLVDKMIHGEAPFNDIDLIICSHVHRDHFNADIVSEFLKNNLKCTLISTVQVLNKLKETSHYSEFFERVIAAGYGGLEINEFNINAIRIETLSFPHSWYSMKDSLGNVYNKHASIQNLGVYVEVDGLKFFHCGDASSMIENEFEAYQLNTKSLDIAFLDRGFLRKTGQSITNSFIQSRHNIYMHIHPDRIQSMLTLTKNYKQLFVFGEQMQSQIFPY